jgi:hypothetical protein
MILPPVETITDHERVDRLIGQEPAGRSLGAAGLDSHPVDRRASTPTD